MTTLPHRGFLFLGRLASASFKQSTVASLLLLAVALARFDSAQAAADQGPRTEFDAASLKLSQPNPPAGFSPGRKGGTYTMWHFRLVDYLRIAFKMEAFQISGPPWMDSARYDIVAKMPPSTTADEFSLMLQTLLVDRLKLKFHREQKVEAIVALAVGRGGPKLKEANGDPDDSESGFQHVPGGGLESKKTTMRTLALLLTRWEDLPVVDMTGIKGYYDVELHFGKPGVPDGLAVEVAVEKLGLKLESRKVPIEHLVIDGGERVPEN
jgi:uncharacterized protein (TIGR03435 family)